MKSGKDFLKVTDRSGRGKNPIKLACPSKYQLNPSFITGKIDEASWIYHFSWAGHILILNFQQMPSLGCALPNLDEWDWIDRDNSVDEGT